MNTQVVLITGALTGIGRATAIAFAQDGAHVVVSGRRDKEGQELAAELEGLGTEAIFVPSDVRNEGAVRDLVDRTVARFGRLDVAVNCAGTEGKPGPVTEQTAETYAATNRRDRAALRSGRGVHSPGDTGCRAGQYSRQHRPALQHYQLHLQ